MSHTDDGTLHTWLDGELEPDEEGRLREHLATCAECRGRLDAARVTRNRAHEILRYADPAHIEQPDFAAVVARRSRAAGGAGAAKQYGDSRLRPLLLPWAASLVLAVGAGWLAQELLRGNGVGGDDRVAAFQSEEADVADADRTRARDLAAGGAEVETFRGDRSAAAPTEPAPPPMPAPTGEAGGGASAPGAPPLANDRNAASEAEPAAAAPLAARAASESVGPGAAQRQQAEALQQLRLSDAVADTPLTWQSVDAVGATEALGVAPRIVSGLEVVSYEAAADGSRAVRVTQRLPGGESVELVQRPAQAEEEEAGKALAAEMTEVVIEAQGLEIRLLARVSADSLRRLAELIQ